MFTIKKGNISPLSFEKISTLKGKNLLPRGAFVPFRADSFTEGPDILESKSEVIKVVYLVQNGGNSAKCIEPS